MIIRKRPFINQFIDIFRRALEQDLEPDEDFETNYIEKGCDIIEQKAKHLKGAIGDEG